VSFDTSDLQVYFKTLNVIKYHTASED